ncbi:MAG TPA: hypothetical protein VJP76_06585 [Candidatus Tumulicola sp.]|nr:hypothetical protein [Candidatus Tumulicola sp.]
MRTTTFSIAALLVATFAAGPLPGAASQPSRATLVAASRCNPRTIDDYTTEVRNDEAHPPKDNPADLNKRLGDLGDILTALGEEHNILDSVCATDSDKMPLFAQLNATTAWALALQSDIAIKLNASCPAAAKALPSAMLAQGWLALAATVNDLGGTVPPAVAQIVPKVQTRAAAVGLVLPAYPDTSAYWRDQIATQAKAAVASCPGEAAPAPSPDASPRARILQTILK